MNFNVKLKNVRFPHCTVPYLNCAVEIDKKLEMRKKYPTEYKCLAYNTSLPVPFGDPGVLNERHLRGADCARNLVTDKRIWERGRDELIKQSLQIKRNSESKSENKSVRPVLTGTLKLAEHLQLDPDPNFSGSYNWYYSGGCVNTLHHSNVNSLLYCSQELPGSCVAVPIDSNKFECVPVKDKSVFLRTRVTQPIFQIDVNNDFVITRQKTCTTQFFITRDEPLKFKRIHQHFEEMDSIVSASICDSLDGEYCTLTTSHSLKRWSPEVKDNCIDDVKINKNNNTPEISDLCDRWGSVKYTSNNNILVSDRSSVYLKDTRIRLSKNVHEWNPQSVNKIPCDMISLILRDSSQAAFIGTSHYLYKLDFRKGFSKQWTHMMEFSPMYGIVHPQDNNCIFMASQNINEVCLIDSNLNVMPYILPSPSETLFHINSQGLCLDPIVSARFKFSMVGFTAIADTNRNNRTFIFRNTSLDDFFYQEVVDSRNSIDCENDCDNDYPDFITKWEKKCLKSYDMLEDKPVMVTDVVDFEKMYSCINGDNSKLVNKIGKHESTHLTSWQPKEIEPNNDFAEALLSVWDVEDDEDQLDTSDTQLSVSDLMPGPSRLDRSQVYQVSPCTKKRLDHSQVDELSPKAKKRLNSSQVDELSPHTKTVTPNLSSATLESVSGLPKNIQLWSDNQNKHSNTLNFEEFDNISCNAILTPNTVVKTKSLAKHKSRFSSGF